MDSPHFFRIICVSDHCDISDAPPPTPLRNSKLHANSNFERNLDRLHKISAREHVGYHSSHVTYRFAVTRRARPNGGPRSPLSIAFRSVPSPRVPQPRLPAPHPAAPTQHSTASCVRLLRAVAGSVGACRAPRPARPACAWPCGGVASQNYVRPL